MDLLELARSAIPQRTEPSEAPARATPRQAAELHRLVAEVCRLTDETDLAGALAIALADADGALTCYRALLAELAPPVQPAPDARDDRRPCTACANLTARGLCLSAWRGVRIGNARTDDYHPAYPTQPRRCEGYAPGPSDSVQRSDRERWPHLIEAMP